MTPQELLARLLTEPQWVDMLRADPEGFATAHGADTETTRRLAALPDQGLRLTASITRQMRAEQIMASFPGTFALPGTMTEKQALLRATSACGELTGPTGIAELGRRLSAAAAELPSDDRTELLRDLIAYERLCHRARYRLAGPAPTPGPPALVPGAVLAVFGRPVAEIRRLVLGGSPLDELPDGATHYMLRAMKGPAGVRSFRLQPELARLLSACDGTRSATSVASEVRLPGETVERVLRTMVTKGFLTWEDTPDGPGPPTSLSDSGVK